VGDKWHLDEVVTPIRGKKYWLWCAVDQHGNVLEILVQSRRNTQAAERFMRKLMKQYGMPRVMITPSRDIAFIMHCRAMDQLRSYGAVKRNLAPELEHRSHKGLNNAAEVSHRLTGSGLFSNHQDMLSNFSPPTIKSTFFSGFAVTNFPPFPTAAPDQMLSLSGTISHAKLRPDKFGCSEKLKLSSTT